MSYRPTLTGHALQQFEDLRHDKAIYEALVERITRLVDEPWDARLVYPGGSEPAFRKTIFGDYGLLLFRVDGDAETIAIFSIIWAG